jgi:hypothetical protein
MKKQLSGKGCGGGGDDDNDKEEEEDGGDVKAVASNRAREKRH